MSTEFHHAAEKHHISADPRVCGGKPCVAGTRIRVWDVHVWHDLRGMMPEEILAEFSQLSVADVHAALTYYHDHRELLEAQNREADSVVEGTKARYPSKIDQSQVRDARDDSIPSG